MLQVPRHAQHGRAKYVDNEGAEWERGADGVELERDVEACEAAEGSEDACEDGLAAPGLGGSVPVGRPYRHEDGAEPGAPGDEDDDGIDEGPSEAQGQLGRETVEQDGNVCAHLERGAAYCHRDDDDCEAGHEGVAVVSSSRHADVGIAEVVEKGEEYVTHEAREAREAATEARSKADVQRYRLLHLGMRGSSVLLFEGFLFVGQRCVRWHRGAVSPLVAEQATVLREEAHEERAAEVGPEHREGGWSAGIEGQPLETQAGQRAAYGEED